MSKIVSAVNAMVEGHKKISGVKFGVNDAELFFYFNDKYKWSISKDANDCYYLCYYPGSQSIDDLAEFSEEDWFLFKDYISYNTKEIGTREAKESFAELYLIVKEKLYGMDEVLEDIISHDIPF